MKAIERARFHLGEHYQQQYAAQIEKGTDPHELEDPAYWANVANICRASGRIFAECEDGTWVADLYIRAVGPQYVLVRILNLWDLSDRVMPTQESSTREGYRVEWSGRFTKWRVVRLVDNAVVHKDEDTREAADGWLREHLKAIKS